MSKAWKRLTPWLPPGEPSDDGGAALRALADVTEVRRLLEQAELAAVRTARRHGRSWTEIATMLAITRQSAWERWRDLDQDPVPSAADEGEKAVEAAGGSVLGRIVDEATDELTGRVRRRRLIKVPDVVGLTAADALGILTRSGLDAVSATPGLGLLEPLEDARPVVVVRQYPEPGVRVRATSTVRLWLERGDGEAGVREPRRPSPPPRAARMERDELTGEAVG